VKGKGSYPVSKIQVCMSLSCFNGNGKDVLMARKPSYGELEHRVRELEKEIFKHKRVEQALTELREYAENIVATVREPLVILDADLRVVSTNHSFYEVFAVKPEETEGQFVYDLGNRQWNIPRLRELLEEIIPKNNTFEGFQMEHDFPTIGRRIMLLNARRMPVDADKTRLILVAIEDVTDRVRMKEALEKSSEKIKLFAYSVSHDLKGPSVGIYGLTKLLHKHYGDILDEKGKNYCDQILKASEEIAALVDKINVYISTKEAPPTIERVKLKDILLMVRDEFSPRLNIRQIKWLEPAYIPEIKADRLSILRVLRNLVDNAFKYGGDDLSEISIGYEESDEFHILSVRDNGIGIRKKHFKKIFGAFQRTQTSRGIEGTGLGLAIVKEIAEQHSGEVWVEPSPEKGTSFYLSISKDLQLSR
jgi:PAS domain S-box-containing protein